MILSREEFTGAQHRLHTVPVNANSSHVQCSVIATGARSARDRVLHFLPREVKFYSFSFHVIDLFLFSAFFNPIDFYIILNRVLLPNTCAIQQHKYLKHGGREFVASQK